MDERLRKCYEECLERKCGDKNLPEYVFCGHCCLCYCRGKLES